MGLQVSVGGSRISKKHGPSIFRQLGERFGEGGGVTLRKKKASSGCDSIGMLYFRPSENNFASTTFGHQGRPCHTQVSPLLERDMRTRHLAA